MGFAEFFKESLVTNQGVITLTEGIDHIEALSADKFIAAIRNLANFIISEKLDGANLVFGFDLDGRFYTSREVKGGDRKYSYNDYGDTAADSGFKSAHVALHKVAPKLKSVLKNGSAVEVEILFGRQPNAIVYGSNYVAFIRMLPGDKREIPDQSIIAQLRNLLIGDEITITVPITTTVDGINIEQKPTKQNWKFSSVSYIDSHHFKNLDLSKQLEAFEDYLKDTVNISGVSFTNNELMTVNLTSVNKNIRPEVKAARENAIQVANAKFKLPIKEEILQKILRVLKPALRDVDVEPHEDIGIEGVVLLDPNTLQQLKIVDKDVFTIINQFNFSIRNEIKSTGKSKPEDFPTLSIAKSSTIFDDMLTRISETLGVPGLGKYLGITNFIKRHKGESKEQTIKNLINEFKNKDLKSLKSNISDAIKEGLQDLKDALEKYSSEWEKYEFQLKTGKRIKYTKEIHNRTLIVFAETRKELLTLLKNVNKADTLGDLVVALYGKQINRIKE